MDDDYNFSVAAEVGVPDFTVIEGKDEEEVTEKMIAAELALSNMNLVI